MENEQKPSYDEVVRMYNNLLLNFNQLQIDKTNERMKLLLDCFQTDSMGGSILPESIRNLAEYQLKMILAKPKKQK